MSAIPRVSAGLVLLVMWGLGIFEYVTAFVPTARHGHAPTTAGYIALYGLLALCAPLLLWCIAVLFFVPEDWI